MFQNGLENLLNDKKRLDLLKNRRVGLLAHPASVDENLRHALDLLIASGVAISAAFGPQHGIKGEKQDNMVESEDFIDSNYHIPMFSLYGASGRHLTAQMLDSFDILLIDLQDLGCRIYTFLTTLCYALEDCAALIEISFCWSTMSDFSSTKKRNMATFCGKSASFKTRGAWVLGFLTFIS